jgi:Domain of unknown function (DUF929)
MRVKRVVAIAGGVVAVAVAVLVPPVAGAASASGGGSAAAVISMVTHVPVSVTDAVAGGGNGVSPPQTVIHGSLLKAGGKPEVLYIGAEYCPYCGTERWSMIVALSRFGTFRGLKEIRSSSADVYPLTATWTFYGTTFTSKYITFIPVEEYSDTPADGGFTTLQPLTPAQQALFTKYDRLPYVPAADADAIPFVDFGDMYLIIGSSYSPGVLSRLSWEQIAADLSRPSTPVARAVDGTANYITAALCELTHDTPATACTPAVKSLQTRI